MLTRANKSLAARCLAFVILFNIITTAAAMSLSDSSSNMLICTSAGLVSVTADEAGSTTQSSSASSHCAMCNTDSTSGNTWTIAFKQAFFNSNKVAFFVHQTSPFNTHYLHFMQMRAPPVFS